MNLPENPQALSIEKFWHWVTFHYNCILRAGSERCVIYDYPDLHWHFLEEEDELLLVQVIRGKDLLVELVIEPAQVMYVESSQQEDNNVLFELVGSINGEPVAFCHFLMSHGYEDEESQSPRKWAH